MLQVRAVDPPRARAGTGDHERALRRIVAGENPDSRLKHRIEADNRLLVQEAVVGMDRDLVCDLPGCTAVFAVRMVPGQLIYPRWCPEHRTPHRRALSLSLSGASI